MVTRRLTPISPDYDALPTPKFEELTKARWSMDYDPEYDVLRIVIDGSRPAISLDMDGMWMRLEPDTGEILGFEIQDFTQSFLPKHPELAMQMLATKPESGHKTRHIDEPVGWVQAFFDFIQSICGGKGGGSHGQFSLA